MPARMGIPWAAVLSLCLLPSCWAEIAVSVVETRGRSALLAVDASTARAVVSLARWRSHVDDPTRQSVSLVDMGTEGDRCVSLVNHDGSPVSKAEIVQVLDPRLEPGEAYELTVQARGRVLAEGEAQVFVEGRSPGGRWEELLRLVLDATTEWLPTSGQFRAREGHQEVRIGLRLRGRGSIQADAITLTAFGSTDNLLMDGGFEGGAYWQIEGRLQAPEAQWRTDPAVIHEPVFRWLNLVPGTTYEARASLMSATGRLLEQSPVVQFRTQAVDVHRVGEMRVTEAVPIGPSSLSAPCVTAAGEGAIVAASHGGGLYAHALLPTEGLGDPMQVVPALEIDGSPAPVEDVQCCAVGDKLAVSYAVSLGPGPSHRSVRLVAKDLRSGNVAGPISLRSPDPLWTVVSARVAECWAALWVLTLEATEGVEGTMTRLRLRALDPTTLQPLGEDLHVGNVPSDRLADPALASTEDHLALLYVDTHMLSGADEETLRDPAPLYVQFFDGRQLSAPRLLTADTRVSQPSATKDGKRLAVVWCQPGEGPVAPGGIPMFQDVGVAWLDADGAVVSLMLPSDRVYARSPSIASVSGRLVVVEERSEHLPGLPHDPAADLGLWATWLEPYTE